MLTKPRLNKIREYISDDGIFPTNIVLNLDSRQIKFDPVEQPHSGDPDGGVLGLMSIRPAYKSAWVIDGQHRLFAYSGHQKAAVSRLAVLAFEGLPSSTQAKLFIDINAKQKSVKQALLQELYADLRWDADDPTARTAAIISRAVQELGSDPESPFFKRIQTTDSDKSETRCISLPSMFNALEKGGFYISRERHGHVAEYGPLGSEDNDVSLQRTTHVLKEWFDLIRRHVPDWWELGSAPGGGLAMNDGVTACIYVLRSVYQHLESKGLKLAKSNEEQLVKWVEPFGNAIGEYLAAFSEQERRAFRAFRGNQGVTRRMRHLQQAIREQIPEFEPQGLEEFLAAERKETNKHAQDIIVRIEQGLQRLIVEELKREFGPDESQWWIEGVPSNVRVKVSEIFERDNASRGAKEAYFDLIDYRTIATSRWDIFGPLLGYGTGNKDKKTSWLVFVNDKRRIVAHASSGKNVSPEDLAQLEVYDQWFAERLSGASEKNPAFDESDNTADQE